MKHRWFFAGSVIVLAAGALTMGRTAAAQRPGPILPSSFNVRLGGMDGVSAYRVVFGVGEGRGASRDGRGGQFITAQMQPQSIRLTREVDLKSPLLYKQSASQAPVEGTIRATGENGEELYRLELKGARITAIQTESGSGERAAEVVTLRATTMEFRVGANSAVVGAAAQ